MRSLSDVTEAEMKAEYDNTPAMNQYVPWAEVLANSIYSTILKNQVISHEEKAMEKNPEQNRIFLAIDNGNHASIKLVNESEKQEPVDWSKYQKGDTSGFKGAMIVGPSEKQMKRRSTITLHQGQIEKIKTALTLSRNCLKYGGMSDVVRNEALDSLAESQKIIQSFYEPRV